MTQPHRLLQAIAREPVDRTPIWIMRQAGRYLPEYRAIRAQVKNFLALCKTPELACEVTLQPVRRFPLDAAIVFSDILTIPDAMGLGLEFIEQEGPKFSSPIRSIADIQALPTLDIENQLHYVLETVSLVRKELDNRIPLIGFAGSPFTLAVYMIEGGASKHFNQIKQWVFREPEGLHLLLQKLTQATADYLTAQIESGAQVIMLFDTWGGILTKRDYLEFSLRYMQIIAQRIHQKHPQTPIILFTKNAGQWLEEMAKADVQVLGIDWTTSLAEARRLVGHKVALQGNLDPATLYASPKRILEEVKALRESYGKHPGHIFNLGHGIQPDTPLESVYALIEAVHL